MAITRTSRALGQLDAVDLTPPPAFTLSTSSLLIGLSIAIVGGTLAGMALRPAVEGARRRVRRARSASNPVWQTLVLTIASGVATGLIVNQVERGTQ